MTDKSFKEKLSEESKLRESIMEDTLRSLEDYKTKQIKEEKKQEQYRIAEIKYKTTINELNDYINIYKKKLSYSKSCLSLPIDYEKNYGILCNKAFLGCPKKTTDITKNKLQIESMRNK